MRDNNKGPRFISKFKSLTVKRRQVLYVGYRDNFLPYLESIYSYSIVTYPAARFVYIPGDEVKIFEISGDYASAGDAVDNLGIRESQPSVGI